jgi:hypothetical protein
MPNGDAQQLAELISAPLEELLVSLGSGIGRSQAELDRHSIETQRRIDEDAVLAQYGLHATWYQIPTADLELKVAVAMERQAPAPAEPGPAPAPIEPVGRLIGGRLFERPLPRLHIQPVNARYVALFQYDVNASSTVKLQIAAVPPAGAAAAGRPTRNVEEIMATAQPHLLTAADGTTLGRVTVNFNPGAAAWFVVQTEEDANGVVQTRTLLKIDDESGSIVRQTGGK